MNITKTVKIQFTAQEVRDALTVYATGADDSLYSCPEDTWIIELPVDIVQRVNTPALPEPEEVAEVTRNEELVKSFESTNPFATTPSKAAETPRPNVFVPIDLD